MSFALSIVCLVVAIVIIAAMVHNAGTDPHNR